MENLGSANTRSNDFRYLYANGIATAFNGIEAIIAFGIKENLGDTSSKIREEVAIVMHPITLKNLAMTLSRVIEDFEQRTGQTIPVDESAKAAVEKALKEAVAAPSPFTSS